VLFLVVCCELLMLTEVPLSYCVKRSCYVLALLSLTLLKNCTKVHFISTGKVRFCLHGS
jgi:hypothetical protein